MTSLAVLLVRFSSTTFAEVESFRGWVARFFPSASLIDGSPAEVSQHDAVLFLVPGEFPLPRGVERALRILETEPGISAVAGSSIEPIQMTEAAQAPHYLLDSAAIDHAVAGRRIRQYLRQPALYRHCVFRSDALSGHILKLTDSMSPIDLRLRLAIPAAKNGHLAILPEEPMILDATDSLATFRILLDDGGYLDDFQQEVLSVLGQDFGELVDGELVERAIVDVVRAELGDRTLRLTQLRAREYLDSCDVDLSTALRQVAILHLAIDPLLQET